MPRPLATRAGAWIARDAAACVGCALIVAFLVAAFAPCPPRLPAVAVHADHGQACHEPADATFLTEPCPCGCTAHAPIAGASARLGVALLSAAPDLAPRLVVELALFATPRFERSFAIPIEHIPLV